MNMLVSERSERMRRFCKLLELLHWTNLVVTKQQEIHEDGTTSYLVTFLRYICLIIRAYI